MTYLPPTEPPTAALGRRQWPLPRQADPNAPLLVVEDLRTHFKLESGWVRAVDGVSFRLNHGEALGLAGESGCGKTTTALSLVRLLPANARIKSGRIELFGIDLVPKSETALRRYRWREISIVFQGAMNALNPVQTVGAQIVEPMAFHGMAEGEEARQRAGALLEMVGIGAERADRYPHEFSGGMRQRAAIAMALACEPKVLLADEPTTALDVMVQAQILDLLTGLSEDLGLTLVFVTHDIPVIAELCDRAAVMYAGEIVEEGPVEALYHEPMHPYTRLLFDAIPDPQGEKEVVSIAGAPPRLDREITGCPFRPRCDVAFERCVAERPRLLQLGDRRRAACHHNDPANEVAS